MCVFERLLKNMYIHNIKRIIPWYNPCCINDFMNIFCGYVLQSQTSYLFMPSRVDAIIEAVVFPFSIVMNAKVFSFPASGQRDASGIHNYNACLLFSR